MYWDLLKVDLFLSPNVFKQTLGLFCRNYSFVNPSRDVLRFGVFGV